MPLQKQMIPIDLTGGLNTKTDVKSLQPGQLAELRNGTYVKGNRIDKRSGYLDIPLTTIFGETVPPGEGVATYQDELILYAGQKIYSYSPNGSGWIDKGEAVSAIIRTEQIIKNDYQQSNPDMAVIDNLALYAWEDTRGGVRYSLQDLETGATLVTDQPLSGLSGSNFPVKVVAFDPYLFIFVRDGDDIKGYRIFKGDLILTAMGAVVSDLKGSSPVFDWISLTGSEALVLAYRDTSDEIQIKQYDADLAALSPSQTVVENADVLTLAEGPGFQIYLGWGVSSVRMQRMNRSLTVLDGPVTVEAVTPTYITIAPDTITFGVAGILYSLGGGGAPNDRLTKSALYTGGVISLVSFFFRSLRLQTKAFEYGGDYFVGMVHEATTGLQDTFFVAKVTGEAPLIIGKQKYAEAKASASLATVSNISTMFHWAIGNKTRLISEGASAPFSSVGVAHTNIDFGDVNVFNAEEIANNLYFAGGILQQYDGRSVVEQGFHLFPDPVTGLATGSGSVDAGEHFIKVCYQWTDGRGQIGYSAPSIQIAVTSGGSDTIEVTIPTMRVSAKEGISLAVFMTEVGGENFYRANSVSTPDINDPSVDTQVVVIDISDTDLIDNDLLYTTGGILENSAPPASSYLEVFNGRLFLLGLEDDVAFWYSKIVNEGVPLEFTPLFSEVVPSIGGGITAGSTLDDKLIIWKRDRPFYIHGDGPNATGAGTFTLPEEINIDVGCSEHLSIVRMPDGLMFKTVKGIYTISSGFTVQYVGAGVEDFNEALITGAILNPDSNEVRYVTQNNRALVYNYYFGRWSTFDNFESNGAVNWVDRFTYLRSDGSVFIEDDTGHKDNGSPVNLGLETGWISLAGIQGFQRIWRFAILGTYKSRHQLRIRVGYDFSDSFTDTYIFDTEQSLDPSTFGSESPYGYPLGEPMGGDSLAYFFRAHLSRQKCSSIRFRIEDIILGTEAEGLNITALALEAGLKGGIARLPVKKSIGAS